MLDHGRPNRAIASSPIPGPRHTPQPQTSQDHSVRQMRLKILYTFDEDKTNCLARWPYPLDIRTAYLTPDTPVGVIELKTCLQAIATASPEIVAGLGQDYTVYAYDYSEYQTPLVGQGMLSWILASASLTPGAPATQSRTMVTGRVCQNAMGLFSNTAQEILEVKLRLVPVPTSRQDEYLESMKKYRDISQMMPVGFDPQVWTTFVQQNPGFIQQAMASRSQSPAIGSGQSGGFGIEHVQRLLSGQESQQAQGSQRRQPLSRAQSFSNAEVIPQLPRIPSPASSVASTAAAPKRRGRKPGPRYEENKRKKSIKKPPAPASTDPGYGTGDELREEGPSRKRAKVTQAAWDGKQDFGKQPDSLRVAASTAASVRIHQPTAVRPGSSAHLELDNQPRAPTPVADPLQGNKRPRMPVTKSNLGRHALLAEDSSGLSFSLNPASEKAVESSPEKSQAESSPIDIASSPPVFPADSTTQSSPRLPEFPRHFDADSGFMSSSLDDLFEDDELRPLDEDDYAAAAQYSKRADLQVPSLNGDHIDEANALLTDTPFPQSEPNQHNALMQEQFEPVRAHSLQRTAPSSALPPPILASDPLRPSILNRSQTWSANEAPHPASDMTLVSIDESAIGRQGPRGRARRKSDAGGQSGHKRKAHIQSKLASSIAAGEVPPFCDNCGAIETPTWRKAWAKVHSGTPEHVRLSDDEGGIIAWQTLQTDNRGAVCLYRIIKKTLGKDDQGFTEMLLCNPCGLWLITRKCMRPKDVYNKSQKDYDDRSKGRPSEPGQRPSNPFSGNINTSNTGFGPEPSSPNKASGQSHSPEGATTKVRTRNALEQGPALSSERPKSPMDEASAAAALEKAILSSPHKFMGSQQIPIEINDLTPQSTRRVLFPSPTNSQRGACNEKTAKHSSGQPVKQGSASSPFEAAPQGRGKENHPPSPSDDIDRFFNEDGYTTSDVLTSISSPKTKYPFLNKTPKKSPSRRPPCTSKSVSSSKEFLHPTTPRRTPTKHARPLVELTPFTASLNQLLSDANAGPPGANDFDFPILPSLRNTPNNTRMLNFDFGQFDSQDLVSTDVLMPSSPPPWDFGAFEGSGGDGQTSLWGDYSLPNTISSPEGSEKRRRDGESTNANDTVKADDEHALAPTETAA